MSVAGQDAALFVQRGGSVIGISKRSRISIANMRACIRMGLQGSTAAQGEGNVEQGWVAANTFLQGFCHL